VYLEDKNIILVIAIIAFTFSFLAIFLVMMAYINIRSNARRQLELVRHAMETEEKERSRIARDLHDSIGQQIYAVRLHLGVLPELNDNNSLRTAVKEKQAMLARATDELRVITRNLMPSSINEYGITGALNDLVESVGISGNFQMIIEDNNKEQRYKEEFEINLFRILQEMINNTVKYAEADTIQISLDHSGDQLQLTYSDNGKGFDTAVRYGMGLKNIEARTKFYKGSYMLSTAPGKGTRYYLNFKNKDILNAE
jgi:two-component system, NarL family, sensor kinase